MISSLIKGDMDLIGSCIDMNPERLAVIDFGIPVGEHYRVGGVDKCTLQP